MTKGNRVLTLAPLDFERYRNTEDNGTVQTAKSPAMPLPTWPNGRWCFEVALYLNSTKKRLSTSSRGGSYATMAYTLSHLIRYCYLNKIGFLELTNSRFTMFIEGLSAKEVQPDGTYRESRTAKRVVTIGRQALSFLYYIGSFYGRVNFVGEHGTVCGYMKSYVVPSTRKGEKGSVKHYWHHASFPDRSPEVRRHPIGDEYISLLRKAVVKLHRSPFLRQRRFLLIRLLDATGARRIELAHLTIASVAEAQGIAKDGGAIFLRLPTFKKRGGPQERFIPIDDVTLQAVVDFIEIYRAPQVASAGFDCGFVFISTRGTELKPNTLTLELCLLRKVAGIEGKAHPHLFRHRYISRRLTVLIFGKDFSNTASVIAYLLKKGAEMTKLLEETGHASISSLEPYIDDVFMAKNTPEQPLEGKDLSRLSASLQATVEEFVLMQETVPAEELLKSALTSFRAYASALNRTK